MVENDKGSIFNLDKKTLGFSGWRPANWMFVSVLIVVTFMAFYPVLSAYFVGDDDPTYLLRNPALSNFSSGWSWLEVQHFFTEGALNNYIPLTTFTYAVEKCFFAPDTLNNPFIFHFDNLLLHIGCTLCVFFLFLKMGVGKWGAFIGALLFGIHPMRVESVAWITERKDVLYGLFYLLALLCYVNYIKQDKHKLKWYSACLAFFLLSCFSKVQAVTLPVCMVAIDLYFNRRWYAAKILLIEKLPWWLLAVAFGVLNVYILTAQKVIGSADVLVDYNFIGRLASGAYAFAVYCVKFIYPYQMLVYYAYPVKVPGLAYVCLFVMPVLLFFVLWKARRNRVVLFGVVFFVSNVVLMLQVVAAGSTYMADRYTYIAYIGLFFLVAKGYEWAMQHRAAYRYYIRTALALYCTMLAFMCYNQAKVWQNSVSLWQHYIDEKPDNYYGYYQLGAYYTDVLLYQLPDPYLDANAPGFNALPLRYLDTAIIKDSMDGKPLARVTANILVNHGVACEFTKMYQEGIDDYTKALAILPGMKEALEKRAWTYFYIKQYGLALQDYDRYQQLDSTSDLQYYRRALCEGNMNRLADGMRDINKAIRLNNADAQYYITRSDFYKLRNMPDSMHIDAQKAKAMGADVPAMLVN